MSVRGVNVLDLEPDELVDEAGFRHRQAELNPHLDSRSIRATLYTAQAGDTVWPYHYHHGVEEWLYVLSGEPLLRDHEGQRRLQPGDLACFPAGPSGAHTFRGPGKFVVVSTGTHREPWMSVYPDSGKVSGPEGMLLASSRVDYWYGEGTYEAPTGPRVEIRELEVLPRAPIVNIDSLRPEVPAGFSPLAGYRARETRLGGLLRARMLGATLYELDPGESSAPYHYERGREEWVLVLSGAPTLRHPGGEDSLKAGDVVCFPDGPDGAHQLSNRDTEVVRLIILSTKEMHSTVHYPDSGKVLVRAGDARRLVYRERDAVDYWDGELGPT